MRGIRDGSYLYYPNVAGMRQNALLYISGTKAPGSTCSIEIRENSPFGPVLGFCKVTEESGEIPCRLENRYGTHNLCFVFRGEGEELLHFSGFHFERVKD